MVDFVLKRIFKKVFKKNEAHALFKILRNQSSKTTAPVVNLADTGR
jgi:hypothetical protein